MGKSDIVLMLSFENLLSIQGLTLLLIGLTSFILTYKRANFFWPIIIIGGILGAGPRTFIYLLLDEWIIFSAISGALLNLYIKDRQYLFSKINAGINQFPKIATISNIPYLIFITWSLYMIVQSVAGVIINNDLRIFKWAMFYCMILFLFILLTFFRNKFIFPEYKKLLLIIIITSQLVFTAYLVQGFIFDSLLGLSGRYLTQDWLWSGSAYAVFPTLIALPACLLSLDEERSRLLKTMSWVLIYTMMMVYFYFESRIGWLAFFGILLTYLCNFNFKMFKTSLKNFFIITLMFGFTFLIFKSNINRLFSLYLIPVNELVNTTLKSSESNEIVLGCNIVIKDIKKRMLITDERLAQKDLNKPEIIKNLRLEKQFLDTYLIFINVKKVRFEIFQLNRDISSKNWDSFDKQTSFNNKNLTLIQKKKELKVLEEKLKNFKKNHDNYVLFKDWLEKKEYDVSFLEKKEIFMIFTLNLINTNNFGFWRDLTNATIVLVDPKGSDVNRQLQYKAGLLRLTDNVKTFFIGDGFLSHRYTILPHIKKLYSKNKDLMTESLIKGTRVDDSDIKIFRTTGFIALLLDTGLIGMILFMLLFITSMFKIYQINQLSLLRMLLFNRTLVFIVLPFICFSWFLPINITDLSLAYILIIPNGLLFNWYKQYNAIHAKNIDYK